MIAEDSDNEIWTTVALWREWREHKLAPVSGGSLDQPVALLEAFGIMEAELSAWEDEMKDAK